MKKVLIFVKEKSTTSFTVERLLKGPWRSSRPEEGTQGPIIRNGDDVKVSTP